MFANVDTLLNSWSYLTKFVKLYLIKEVINMFSFNCAQTSLRNIFLNIHMTLNLFCWVYFLLLYIYKPGTHLNLRSYLFTVLTKEFFKFVHKLFLNNAFKYITYLHSPAFNMTSVYIFLSWNNTFNAEYFDRYVSIISSGRILCFCVLFEIYWTVHSNCR